MCVWSWYKVLALKANDETMTFFKIIAPETLWGDYDYILMHGMAERNKQSGLLGIMRTAPFVPPIFFPSIGEIVVNDDLRIKLERSGLTGFTFRPVTKQHIVENYWHEWNKNADEPELYPVDGEPEAYVLDQPHSEQLALQMPLLWEVIIEKTAQIERTTDAKGICRGEIYLMSETWQGFDLFRASGVGYNFVTETAKFWLENKIPDFISFQHVLVK